MNFRELMNLIQTNAESQPIAPKKLKRGIRKSPPPSTMENLTPMERSLKNILKHCETEQDLEKFIAGLPTARLQQMANNVIEHMILQQIDQQTQKPQSLQQAAKVLGKYTR